MGYGRAVSRCLVVPMLAAALPAAFAADARTCPDVSEPPAAVCLAATHGLTYADSQDDARVAASALDTAAVQFRQVFGRDLPPGLLVLSSTFSGEDARQFARDQGLAFSQSWPSPADKRA